MAWKDSDMCGIAFAIPNDAGFVEQALQSQASRGPDDHQVADVGLCTLGVNRLAITDLEHGSQPLRSRDGRTVLVFNGAIYNSGDLIDRYGLDVINGNDGEVVHGLYERFGSEFPGYLEGMFSICLVDVGANEVILAIDSIGIKPLYVVTQGTTVFGASTPESFPVDMKCDVRRFPPGVVWSSRTGFRRYALRAYREGPVVPLLSASVREQLPHEVAWGCLLSGGVDSALIAALAKREYRGDVITITCGTEDSEDRKSAAEIAAIIGTKHCERIVSRAEILDAVRPVVRATQSFEPWTIMGGVGTYLACSEAAAQGLKVLLSGEGADELFGGYDEFLDISGFALNAMLAQYQVDLGTSECLRLDRCSMAHSIEARVPFLCTSVVKKSRMIPVESNVSRSADGVIVKKALREAAGAVLPNAFAFRQKQEFSVGSGVGEVLTEYADSRYSSSDVMSVQNKFAGFAVTTPTQAWFLELWGEETGLAYGGDLQDLTRRGLFRQAVGEYSAHVVDPAVYGESIYG